MRRKASLRALAATPCMAAIAILAAAGGAAAQAIFNTPAHYSVGLNPRDVAAGDLNGDGWADLAVANEGTGTVSVLINDGDGTFGPASGYAAGTSPLALAIARLDGDAYPDIVTSNSAGNDVSVLLNLGDGTFAAPVGYPVGATPMGILAEDLNGDGACDVAVVNHDSGSFTVLLNDGDGILSTSGSYSASGAYIKPSWLAAGRLDTDEYPDIVVVKNYHNLYFNASYAQLFTNDGSGGFVAGRTIDIGVTATTPLTEDFDGDGDVDIAVSGFAENSYKLATLLNDGEGKFADPVLHYAGASGRACTGDFDLDGHPDVAISTEGVYASSFTYVLNQGSGAFSSALSIHVGDDPMGQASADLDQDGDWDVAVAVLGDNTVAVAMSSTDPTGVAEHEGTDSTRILRAYQSCPNPLRSSTLLSFDIVKPARVTVRIYNTSGRLVRTLVTEEMWGAGRHEESWDGRDSNGREVGAGVYLVRAEGAGRAETGKLAVLR